MADKPNMRHQMAGGKANGSIQVGNGRLARFPLHPHTAKLAMPL